MLQAIPQTKWKGRYAQFKEYKLLIFGYFVKHWKCFLYVLPLFFPVFSQDTYRACQKLSRLGLALSNEHGFSFIAQTFTILFAMQQPAAWQRLPLYQSDIFWLFSSFSWLQCCAVEEGNMTDKFHFMPTTIVALLFDRGGFVCKPLYRKMKRRNQADWMFL